MYVMDWYSRYLYCIVLSVLKVHSSAVVLKDVPLNWRDANEACQLISFSKVKTEYEHFIYEMNTESSYWIQDAVTEFSIVNKGCQKTVTIQNSTTITKNMLSDCFKFCQKSSKTIGIKGNNCSCLNAITSDKYLPINKCDLLCVWKGRPCRTEVFSVFEQKDKLENLGGFQLEECLVVGSNTLAKLSCSSKAAYICQGEGEEKNMISENLDKVTWMEAVSKCAEKNQTLAYHPDSYNRFLRSRDDHWIGIRQYYQTASEKEERSKCSVVRRFNLKDIFFTSSNCNWETKYICLTDSSSSNVVGIVIGVLATLAILLLVFVCLFKRRRNNSRSAYQSPVVEYSTEQRRDSKQSQTKSVKSSPLKPARRSKKANPDSLVSGTEYENIVLTFEDPSTISRVVSSTSTDRTEILKEEENYDLMNTGNNETSSNVTSQNVYGFSPPEGEYDVMNRDNRNVNEFNPDYDHM